MSVAMPTTAPSAHDLADCWSRLRTESPLTQCLTNIVVAPFTANVLLAAGASPAMVDNPHEAGQLAAVAGAVLVNLGTPYDDTAAGAREGVSAALSSGTPWVLDPVAVGGLTWRTGLAHELLALGSPAVIRGNASEVLALGGGSGGRGVDATDDTASQAVRDGAGAIARRHRCVVAVSGAVDHLTDGERTVRLAHGDPLMTRVTGVGCALGALVAACCAATSDPLVAAATATAALTLAADTAVQTARGPGSFAVGLLDELAALTPDQIEERVGLC